MSRRDTCNAVRRHSKTFTLMLCTCEDSMRILLHFSNMIWKMKKLPCEDTPKEKNDGAVLAVAEVVGAGASFFRHVVNFRVHHGSMLWIYKSHSDVKTVHARGISRQAMSLHALSPTVFAVQEQMEHKQVYNSGTSNVFVFWDAFGLLAFFPAPSMQCIMQNINIHQHYSAGPGGDNWSPARWQHCGSWCSCWGLIFLSRCPFGCMFLTVKLPMHIHMSRQYIQEAFQDRRCPYMH